MLQHAKHQVKLFEMHCMTIFVTALSVIFLLKLIIIMIDFIFILLS